MIIDKKNKIKNQMSKLFYDCFQFDPSPECNILELESTLQICWDRMGVSLKNPEITKMGTVCEVQKNGENFTTFMICTTTGWTATQNEGMIIALLFQVFMSNSILKI